MNKKIVSLAVTATLSLTAFSASAEDMYRGAWYAVPGASYMNTDSDLDADNGAGGFIAIGKELSPSWDLQGRLGYNRADEDTGIAGASGKYKSTQLGLDALYMFSRDKFRPFLLAGLGATRNDLDYKIPGFDVDGKKTSWLAGLGLGAQYLFSDNFGLQADLRQQFSRGDGKLTNLTTGASGSDSGSVSNTLFNLGGIFRFGAPAPVVAEPAPEPAPIAAAPEPAPEPEPAPVVAPAPCEPKFKTVTLQAERLFSFDKFKLSGDAVTELDSVIATLKEHPEFDVVVVTGHTDRIGSEKYNQKLSEQRANEIKAHLVSHDIDANRISAVGKGESEPLVECKGIKGKALIECLAPNRRVEINGERKHQENECK